LKEIRNKIQFRSANRKGRDNLGYESKKKKENFINIELKEIGWLVLCKAQKTTLLYY